VVAALCPVLAFAQPSGQTKEEFEAKLGYQTGTVTVGDGLATIALPPSFRFIGPDGSKRLLTEAWGNPPGAADDVLGMLIPVAQSPLSDGGWGVVVSFDDDGYVNDDDAGSLDYSKMLTEMQASAREGNEDRKAQGFEPVTLVGWAEPPHYDKGAHKLYWAKELAFGDSADHTLNYNIRILGRRGVLVLNAVSGMDQLATIRTESQALLPAVEFKDGHRYTDYLPGKDKAATYGLVGLIAGAGAAKAGLFKALWIGLLASKKLIAGLIFGGAAAVKKFFTKSSDAQTT
jgi:uncharacterized membrane-anchored protein